MIFFDEIFSNPFEAKTKIWKTSHPPGTSGSPLQREAELLLEREKKKYEEMERAYRMSRYPAHCRTNPRYQYCFVDFRDAGKLDDEAFGSQFLKGRDPYIRHWGALVREQIKAKKPPTQKGNTMEPKPDISLTTLRDKLDVIFKELTAVRDMLERTKTKLLPHSAGVDPREDSTPTPAGLEGLSQVSNMIDGRVVEVRALSNEIDSALFSEEPQTIPADGIFGPAPRGKTT